MVMDDWKKGQRRFSEIFNIVHAIPDETIDVFRRDVYVFSILVSRRYNIEYGKN